MPMRAQNKHPTESEFMSPTATTQPMAVPAHPAAEQLSPAARPQAGSPADVPLSVSPGTLRVASMSLVIPPSELVTSHMLGAARGAADAQASAEVNFISGVGADTGSRHSDVVRAVATGTAAQRERDHRICQHTGCYPTGSGTSESQPRLGTALDGEDITARAAACQAGTACTRSDQAAAGSVRSPAEPRTNAAAVDAGLLSKCLRAGPPASAEEVFSFNHTSQCGRLTATRKPNLHRVEAREHAAAVASAACPSAPANREPCCARAQVRAPSGGIDLIAGTEPQRSDPSLPSEDPAAATTTDELPHPPHAAADGIANVVAPTAADRPANGDAKKFVSRVWAEGKKSARHFRRHSTGEDFEASAGPRGKDGYGDASDTRHVGVGSRWYDPRKDVVLRIECATDAQTRVRRQAHADVRQNTFAHVCARSCWSCAAVCPAVCPLMCQPAVGEAACHLCAGKDPVFAAVHLRRHNTAHRPGCSEVPQTGQVCCLTNAV